jgi:transposase
MNIKTLGIDLAKNVFQLHGVDERGQVVLRKRVSRAKLLPTIANVPACLIGLEACSGSYHWARQFMAQGHEVKLMSPNYVKPYVKTNKNDENDAEGICEAVTRPSMRFVSPKTVEQQDLQALHRVRSRVMKERTALANQARGLLAEYGVAVAQGIHRLRHALPRILEDAENGLSSDARELFAELYEQLLVCDERVEHYDARIKRLFKRSPVCQKLACVEGVGPLIATAMVAAVGDASAFKNGRQLAAWLGLTPRQHSSGGKPRLLGISKRGDSYLRTLLIHGARSVVSRADHRDDARSRWVSNIKARRGTNRACVALANKNARILWALMTREEAYHKAA